MNGCLECTSTSVCTSCDGNNHWEGDPDNQQCKCVQKYVEINNLCESCPIGCNVCDQNLTCQECDATGDFIPDGAGGCKCNTSHYFDNTTSLCNLCIPGC